ncbi:MAG: hypothetical protein J6D15_05345 [Clostridia bacterium]|nr:hypothetical protein [Clostridia bacterium]
MNIQDLISKMSPEMLAQGLKQLSGGLNQEQLKKAEETIKMMSQGSLQKELSGLDAKGLQDTLTKNPELAKQLAQNPQLLSALAEIVKKK